MVGFRCGFEEIGRVVFQCIHPRLQIGDVVLVELALQIGALDTEVCGKEKASKLRDQLFLSIGRASEAGVEFTGEGSLIGTLETQYRRDERIIRFLTFKQDKFAVEYSEKRRAKLSNKQEE